MILKYLYDVFIRVLSKSSLYNLSILWPSLVKMWVDVDLDNPTNIIRGYSFIVHRVRLCIGEGAR